MAETTKGAWGKEKAERKWSKKFSPFFSKEG
jgi:hypothetical protein